jgi:sensor histidine kinase regulating citrate/malate metabolism
MIVTIGIISLAFSLLLVAITNQLMVQALRRQIERRAFVMATNLSDAAAGHVIARNVLELHALVTKYARLEGAAYAFIEDHAGQILAHSMGTSAPETRKSLTLDERRQVERQIVSLQGKTVYDTRAPILEGQVGTVHVAIWEEDVEAEIYTSLRPILGLITIVLLVGIVLSVLVARGLIWGGAHREPHGG